MSETTGRVLRHSLGPSLLHGALFVIAAPFTCLLGIPPAMVMTRLVRYQFDRMAGEATGSSERPLGGLGVIYLFFLGAVFAALAGSSIMQTLFVERLDELQCTAIGGFLAVALYAGVALPFAFVPLVSLDGGLPSAVGSRTFLIAARAVTRLPLGRRLALVANATLALMVPLMALLLTERRVGLSPSVAAMAVSAALLLPISSAFYVASYGRVRDGLDDEVLDGDPVALPAIVRATSASAAVSALALGLLAVATAMTPSPMRDPVGEVRLDELQEWTTLPGSDVVVRAAGEGVTVAARDGGGVGHVPVDCGVVTGLKLIPLAGPPEAPTEVQVLARCADRRARAMRIDSRGVRLDDSFSDRLRERTGATFFVLLLIALALWGATLHGPGRALTRVRYLGALASTDEEAPPDGAPAELRALEGTLRTEGGVSIAGDRFEVDGSAQVMGSGTLRVALPAVGAALALDEERLSDGARVAVVGRFERGVGAGLREGPVPWPTDGQLVAGGRRAAAERLTERLSRRLALQQAALVVVQTIAAVVLALSW